jgi:hypothetical protein
MTMTDKDDQSAIEPDTDSPNYWSKAFKGTPESIVVPPYIRFLQGVLLLRKAEIFLKTAKTVASGHPHLASALAELESSKESKQLEVNYETYFASHLTINLVSEVENFFAAAISAALRMYPEKMGSQSFKLTEIISANSTDELIDRAANAALYGLMYEKPLDYIKSLASILSIETESLGQYWPAFVELKARRDLGVHGNWVVNETYLRKLREAKITSTHVAGDRVIPDFSYLSEALKSCQKLVDAMANLLGEKWIKVNME